MKSGFNLCAGHCQDKQLFRCVRILFFHAALWRAIETFRRSLPLWAEQRKDDSSGGNKHVTVPHSMTDQKQEALALLSGDMYK